MISPIDYMIQLEQEIDKQKKQIDKAIELIKYTIQHYEELRKTPFADSVFQSDMLRQSFITTIQSFLELLLEDLGDKE